MSTVACRRGDSLTDALACIEQNGLGVACVLDEDSTLAGVVTDGDLRRALLDRLPLDAKVDELIARKAQSPYARPVTARFGSSRAEMLRIMRQYRVRQLPLLDEAGRLVDLVTLDDLVPAEPLPVRAVVMAGGFGKRLLPLTTETPKPMLPIGDKPLLERIIARLRESGIRQVSITTHHQAEKIRRYFGDGSAFGVEVNYVNEETPLGTAGALSLLESDEPLLVMNGDILTQVEFRSMLDFHQQQKAELTVGVRQFHVDVPYGVVDVEGTRVRGIREKPRMDFLVSAGIYLVEPSVRRGIRAGAPIDMTQVIERLLEEGRRVASFPVLEYWLDIGRPADYEQAQRDADNGRIRR